MNATIADVLAGREAWALCLGDCLDPVTGLASLPGRIERSHAITDPPYSEHVHSCNMRGSPGWKKPIAETRELGFVHLEPAVRTACAAEFARIVDRWIAVFSDTESAHQWRDEIMAGGTEYVRTAFWHKIGGAPQFTGDRPAVACEAITICHPAGKKHWNGGGKQGFYSFQIAITNAGDPRNNIDGRRNHPTQKPLALMEALVRDFTDPGDLVIDPFAGSGTTGVACIRLGRRFIGWERDEKYHGTAMKRLQAAREQMSLFTAPSLDAGPRTKPGQGTLFEAKP